MERQISQSRILQEGGKTIEALLNKFCDFYWLFLTEII